MRNIESLPTKQSMKSAHPVRRFRRSNAEHGAERKWLANSKPWKTHAPRAQTVPGGATA